MIINAKEFQDKFEVSKTKTKKSISLFNKIMSPFKSATKAPVKQKLKKLNPTTELKPAKKLKKQPLPKK